MSSTVSFFVSFRIGSLDGKVQSDRFIISNHVHQYVVEIESWVFYAFFIIKCVSFKLIHLAINLNATSLSEVFITFDYVLR